MVGKKKQKRDNVGVLVLQILREKQAFDEKSAVKVAVFKNLPFSSETIAYTIGDFYEHKIIKVTTDERYYLDQIVYNSFRKKKTIQLYMLIALPVVLFIIFYVVMGGGFKAFLR